jgi:tetratricopeptide (TPR) repeat protein
MKYNMVFLSKIRYSFKVLAYIELAYYLLGRLDWAYLILDRITRLNPTDDMAWLGKGAILYAQKKYAESIVALDMGIKLNPAAAAEAWNGKGMALDALGKHEEAILAYDEARKLGLKI